MRKLVLVIATLLAMAPHANASSTLLRAGGTIAAYVGPGDLVSFDAWCGLRAYSAATAGTKSIRIQRASDSALTDISTLATGAFDTATASSFCNATTCTATKCYDKVGTIDLTAASQPSLVFNCVNTSLPCLQSTSGSFNMFSSSHTPTGAVVNFSFVSNRSSGTGQTLPLSDFNPSATTIIGGSANQLKMVGFISGVLTSTASDATWHAYNATCNGASTAANVDGTVTTGSVTCGAAGGGWGWQGAASTTLLWAEGGVLHNGGTAWSTGNRSALQGNQKAYWGTP